MCQTEGDPAAPALQESRVLVYEDQLEAFEKKLASLAKKAQSFGLEPPRATARAPFLFQLELITDDEVHYHRVARLISSVDQAQGEAPHIIVRAFAIDIVYPLVKLGNWRVIGMMEPYGTSTLVFPFSQDEEELRLVDAYRLQFAVGCDHCHTKRRRALGFILREDGSGRVMQVGSTCLRDFLGIDPAAALFLAKMVSSFRVDDDPDEARMSSMPRCISTLHFLTNVVFLVQRTGFVSASKARDSIPPISATYEDALALAFDLDRSHELRASYNAQYEANRAKAQEVLDWAKAQPDDPTNSFAMNLKAIVSEDLLSLRNTRYAATAAAAVPTFERANAAKREAALRIPSRHFGAEGEKIERELTLKHRAAVDGMYGTQFILSFVDEEHRVFVWKTASPPQDLCDVRATGRTFLVKCTIKKHGVYREVLQTEVSRLKILAVIREASQEALAA
jgi:hypothetical protein